MAVGLASAVAASMLDAFLNATAYTGPANVYLKLHVGDPGAAGAANAAVETTRKEVTFGAASGGAITSDNAPSWTNVAGTEDYTHVSLWTAAAAGTFQGSGTVTASAVTAGDTFTLAVADVDMNLTNIAS